MKIIPLTAKCWNVVFLKLCWVFPLVFYFFSSLASAQAPTSSVDQFRKEGQLVTIQISRGNPVRIFVVGREEAKLDPSRLQLTVRRIKPYPGKILQVDQFNNYFVIPDSQEFQKAKELEITTTVQNKKETFHFDLKQEKP